MNLSSTQKSEALSSGIENLISQLKQDGVQRGQQEAEAIIAQAKADAEKIVNDAKKEADAYHQKQRNDIETMRASAEEELRSVYRDSLLKMKEYLTLQFTKKIQKLISETTQDKQVLEKMILDVTRMQSKGNAEQIEILLPSAALQLETLQQNPELLTKDAIGKFVSASTAKLLQDGITLFATDNFKGGIKVSMVDSKVEIDISDKALSEALMHYLQPRFQAILEGVVK